MSYPLNSDTAELAAKLTRHQGTIYRELGSSNHGSATSMLEATTLEKCRNQAMNNMYAINDLGSRVAALLDRLRGPQLTGGSGSEGDSEPRGMLVVHLEQLEYEAQRLGEIQADLALLEQLL
jgi:IS30 family transposase